MLLICNQDAGRFDDLEFEWLRQSELPLTRSSIGGGGEILKQHLVPKDRSDRAGEVHLGDQRLDERGPRTSLLGPFSFCC